MRIFAIARDVVVKWLVAGMMKGTVNTPAEKEAFAFVTSGKAEARFLDATPAPPDGLDVERLARTLAYYLEEETASDAPGSEAERVLQHLLDDAEFRAAFATPPPPDALPWDQFYARLAEQWGTILDAADKAENASAEEVIEALRAQWRHKVPAPAVRAAARFVEESITPRRCDSEAVANCWRCTTVFLSRTLIAAIEGADATPPPPDAMDVERLASTLASYMEEETASDAPGSVAERVLQHLLNDAEFRAALTSKEKPNGDL